MTSCCAATSTSSWSPTRASHASLAAYVEVNTLPYVTARGVDLVEVEEDPPLILDGRPLLAQRRWGVRTASLSKTALTTVRVKWAPGFHAADAYPIFDDLYLVHTKFSDVKGRIAWFKAMLDNVQPGSTESTYYGDGRSKIEAFHTWLCKFNRNSRIEETILDTKGFDSLFLASIENNNSECVKQGEFIIDHALRAWPSQYQWFL